MVRFRPALLALLASTALLAAGAVGAAAYVNGRAAARDLSGQVLDQTSERVDELVERLLDQAADLGRTTRHLLETNRLRADDAPGLVEFWRGELAARPDVTSAFLGLERTGEAVGVTRIKGRLTVWQTAAAPGGGLELREYWADEYPARPFRVASGGPDVRPRPWYSAAAAKRAPVWTDTYTFIGADGVADAVGLTYAVPVAGPGGGLTGVLTVDFDLGTLSRYLAGLRVGRGGVAFLAEYGAGGARVIAHPRPGADPVADALLAALPPGGGRQLLRFEAAGGAYLGGTLRVADEGRPKWLIGTYLPESEVTAAADRAARQALLIAAALVALAVAASAGLARQAARPLEELAGVAEEAGRLRLEARPVVRSPLTEVARLARAAEEMKAGLRSFEKYVPADLVRELLASGREARLGGESRVLTVAFTDIAGFTATAETYPGGELVEHLGDYLAAVGGEVLASGGTVDKYIGDAVMAFWGAPAPAADHAARACVAAWRLQQRLRELRPGWAARGRPPFPTRVGVHTGEVVVGNIGSPGRMNYTVIGDAVNLASRVEGLNKYYGTDVLLTADAARAAGAAVLLREVDRVAVAGRSEPVAVYELIGLAGEAPSVPSEVVEGYAAALAAYRAREWGEALRRLEEVLAARPADGPSLALRERCAALRAAPPGDDWDGARRMGGK